MLGHFANVLHRLQARAPRGLTRSQSRARREVVDQLARYRARGVFPTNRLFRGFNPTFIDTDGTRCAVAHLLDRTGEASLAQEIARTHNFERVRSLLVFDELRSWVERSGLSADEAALIQPSYCQRAWDCVCVSDPETLGLSFEGVVEATVVSSNEVRIDGIHGEAGGAVVGQAYEFTSPFFVPETGQRIVGPLLDSFVVVHLLVGPDGAPELPDYCLITESDLVATPSSIPLDAYVNALLAEDCAATLRQEDFRWGLEDCNYALVEADAEGCSAAGNAAAGSWLLAVSALASGLLLARLGGRRRPASGC